MTEVERWHFSGIGGAGMNPLARLLAARGLQVQGSDRDFDRGRNQAVAELLQAAGIRLLPQDGDSLDAGITRLVHSTAVEATTPEMLAAARLQLATVTRPALLAELVNAAAPGVAIAGTSGKSTVTGMLAWCLRCAGLEATVLGGAALAEAGAKHMGCFMAAEAAAPLVAEACESDGSLVGYAPGLGAILNISRDHQELSGLAQQFTTFAAASQRLLICGDCAASQQILAPLARHDLLRFGQGEECDYQYRIEQAGPWRASAQVTDPEAGAQRLELPQPGAHNVANAVAAYALARQLGCPVAAALAALADFPGVARRFQVLGTTDSGITVVDDYAHNGAKIAAAVGAAQLGCRRLVAIFQPHGYGPARFLRQEMKDLLPQLLRAGDRFCYAPIYDAGGTVTRDITSKDLAADLPPDMQVVAPTTPEELFIWVAEQAQAGDTVLLMGARDPQLPELAAALYGLL